MPILPSLFLATMVLLWESELLRNVFFIRSDVSRLSVFIQGLDARARHNELTNLHLGVRDDTSRDSGIASAVHSPVKDVLAPSTFVVLFDVVNISVLDHDLVWVSCKGQDLAHRCNARKGYERLGM